MDRRFKLKQNGDKLRKGNIKDTIFALGQKWGQLVAVAGIIVGVVVIIWLIA